jgi:hypothetical protein
MVCPQSSLQVQTNHPLLQVYLPITSLKTRTVPRDSSLGIMDSHSIWH